MDRALFRNINNLNLVDPNQIRHWIYTCIKSLFNDFVDIENITYMHLPFDVTSHHRRPVSRVSTGCLSLSTGNITLHPTLHILCKCCARTKTDKKYAPRPNLSNVGPEWSTTRIWTCSNTRPHYMVKFAFYNLLLHAITTRQLQISSLFNS